MSQLEHYSNFLADNGFRDEVQEIIAEYKKSGAESASKFISDRMLSSLTICGVSEDCRESLSKVVSTGITLPILQFNPVGILKTHSRRCYRLLNEKCSSVVMGNLSL